MQLIVTLRDILPLAYHKKEYLVQEPNSKQENKTVIEQLKKEKNKAHTHLLE